MLKQTLKDGKTELVKQLANPLSMDEVFINIRIRKIFLSVAWEQEPDFIPPPFANVDFPYFIFGEYDRRGAYSIGRTILPTTNIETVLGGACGRPTSVLPYYFVGSVIPGNFAFGSPDLVAVPKVSLGNVQYFVLNYLNLQKLGSLVDIYYTRGLNVPPNPISVAIIAEMDFQSYASLCANTANEVYICREIIITYDNNTQYLKPIKIIRTNAIGQFTTQELLPTAYKPADNLQGNTIRIPVNFRIDQYLGLTSMINFLSLKIEYSFRCTVKHIKN